MNTEKADKARKDKAKARREKVEQNILVAMKKLHPPPPTFEQAPVFVCLLFFLTCAIYFGGVLI